jgi:hypothetical protein
MAIRKANNRLENHFGIMEFMISKKHRATRIIEDEKQTNHYCA